MTGNLIVDALFIVNIAAFVGLSFDELAISLSVLSRDSKGYTPLVERLVNRWGISCLVAIKTASTITTAAVLILFYFGLPSQFYNTFPAFQPLMIMVVSLALCIPVAISAIRCLRFLKRTVAVEPSPSAPGP